MRVSNRPITVAVIFVVTNVTAKCTVTFAHQVTL